PYSCGFQGHPTGEALDKMMNGRKSKKNEAAANYDRLHASLFAWSARRSAFTDCSRALRR
ncbi:MAG TPA: hypothetical protein VGV15_07190, partial [Terriglobales bacterium]|nr:hypothetical protein [Terriglobales bacterium]